MDQPKWKYYSHKKAKWILLYGYIIFWYEIISPLFVDIIKSSNNNNNNNITSPDFVEQPQKWPTFEDQ